MAAFPAGVPLNRVVEIGQGTASLLAEEGGREAGTS